MTMRAIIVLELDVTGPEQLSEAVEALAVLMPLPHTTEACRIALDTPAEQSATQVLEWLDET